MSQPLKISKDDSVKAILVQCPLWKYLTQMDTVGQTQTRRNFPPLTFLQRIQRSKSRRRSSKNTNKERVNLPLQWIIGTFHFRRDARKPTRFDQSNLWWSWLGHVEQRLERHKPEPCGLLPNLQSLQARVRGSRCVLKTRKETRLESQITNHLGRHICNQIQDYFENVPLS